MSIINVLSPHVADLIAAGEVVERPASVIKELAENGLDAGAKNITIEIRGGGATYIRVTDDGCGMSPEDAGVAFLRHATSKLHTEGDLEHIATMGFRGEALAAISAVSHIRLTTRQRGAAEGTIVTLDAGDIQDMGPIGCPEGTTMVIQDLFYNTPARQKFLKSDRSEATACQLAALRCALAHPEVSFRFLRDGDESFFSPGDGREDSAIYALLGRDVASGMLKCTGQNENISVGGYVSSPNNAKGNRSGQYFFCNGRFIKSSLLQAALEQAYKNSLLTGRYPSCVLYLTIPFASVDVNVHPAKTEVKFTDERKVFDAVYYAVRSALEGEVRAAAPSRELPKSTAAPAPDPNFYRSMSSEQFRANGYSASKAPARPSASESSRGISVAPPRGGSVKLPTPVQSTTRYTPTSLRSPDMQWQTSLDLPRQHTSPKTEESHALPSVSNPAGSKIVEKPVQNVEKPSLPDHNIVGEAMKTYIIVEKGEELILIDKHAAHERMIFDKLKARQGAIMAQALLLPATVKPTAEDCELLEQYSALLAELGFEIEPYGEDTYIVRAVPADMDSADVSAALEEICEKLRRGKTPDPKEARDEILHTVACKAAIKAGWNTTRAEEERVAEEVLSGRVKYCPHGRPVSVTLTKKELDKLFRRIV